MKRAPGLSRRDGRDLKPRVEGLEGRALLSGLATPPTAPRAVAIRTLTLPGGVDNSGRAAILSALRGGPGSEFVRVIRPQVPNLNAVLLKFQLGLIDEYAVRGAVFRNTRFRDTYTGPRFDQLKVVGAGAVLLSRRRLELGAILDGPIDAATNSVYVFGIDRGGATIAPIPGLPSHRLDALVTVVRSPSGAIAGVVQDLKTGASTPIAAKDILAKGATLRVFVDTKRLPSTGAAVGNYRFALAARDATTGGPETVASVASSAGTIPIGGLRRR